MHLWTCVGRMTPSTAIESFGEIEVPRNLSENEQRQRVAQIERTWRDQQPTIEGEKVLLAGYETYILDTSREIQYNKLSVSQQGDVEATMHRPLREGKPWAFHGLEGISAESLEQTDGNCVSYQLSKHIKIKGFLANGFLAKKTDSSQKNDPGYTSRELQRAHFTRFPIRFQAEPVNKNRNFRKNHQNI